MFPGAEVEFSLGDGHDHLASKELTLQMGITIVFSGGMMPSDDLPLFFQDNLKIEQRWRWNGCHYQKTAVAWLENLDNNRDRIWPVLESTYGRDFARMWFMRWRMFFLAVAELFGYDDGNEWFVSHYLFSKPGQRE